MLLKLVVAAAYFLVLAYLGYRGFKETRTHADYLLAGRQMTPFVMAMSYGATFISTSAIVGFGGVAGQFGFSLLWLVFLNISVGVFLAMAVFGTRTRRMGLALDCHTFPELLGRRYDSRFIQCFSGGVVFLFMPLYAAAVLIGMSRMAEVSLGMDFHLALVALTLATAAYVITGGLKAVMYTDAFQGTLMVFMLLFLVLAIYARLGGVVEAHQALTDMGPLVPEKLSAMGMTGWTEGPRFGTPLWLIIYTTITYGVGIGVLAQPQLIVRFMTVAGDRELHRGVLFGGLFILLIPGSAYVTGALSNVVFFRETGKTALEAVGGNVDKVIPAFIDGYMPEWFGVLFLMALLAAAMSTLSAQYHVGGTSLGRDVLEQVRGLSGRGPLAANRFGALATIVLTLLWAWVLPESIIARATAFFFGLCAATFLPAYILGLYWRGMNRSGAAASMLGGFVCSMFWLLFVNLKEASTMGLCQWLTGKPTLLADAAKGSALWLAQFLDPNVVALPVALGLALAGSLLGRASDPGHLEKCWKNFD